MAKVAELGAAFLERLASHLPEDKRADFLAMATGTPAVVEEAGRGGLRQEDYSRVREQQTAWYQENSGELERLRAAAGGRTGDPTNPNPNPPARREDPPQDPNKAPVTQEQARAIEKDWLNASAIMTELAQQHFAEFGQPLAVGKLTQEAMEKGMTLRDYYGTTVAAERETRRQKKYDDDMAAAEARGKAAGRAEIISSRSDIPYPVGSSQPTTLAGLRKPAEGQPNDFSLDAAVGTLVAEMNKSANA